MGGIFYLIGIVIACFAGYSGFEWFFIFIASSTMAVGYFIMRAPQMYGAIADHGAIVIPKLLLTQIVFWSIITTPFYFIATIFS